MRGKKLLAFILAAGMAGSALAGCMPGTGEPVRNLQLKLNRNLHPELKMSYLRKHQYQRKHKEDIHCLYVNRGVKHFLF